jgi:hypothetical protein
MNCLIVIERSVALVLFCDPVQVGSRDEQSKERKRRRRGGGNVVEEVTSIAGTRSGQPRFCLGEAVVGPEMGRERERRTLGLSSPPPWLEGMKPPPPPPL